MDFDYLQATIGDYKIECIWKTGSQVYCSDGSNNDIDYLVTIKNWNINYKKINYEGVDYFCWDCDYYNLLCENFENENKMILFFEGYLNNLNNIIYGERDDHLKILENRSKYENLLYNNKDKWLLSPRFSFKRKEYPYHNLIFCLIPHFWILNNAYILTEEQQNIINRLHLCDVEEKELRELIDLI